MRINRGIRFARASIGPYATKLGPKRYARAVVRSKNLANDYIKDFNNWTDSSGVAFANGDFYGRTDVWTLTNLATSGVTMVYDFTAKESSGGPVLTPGVSYEIIVDMYSPSSNTQNLAGSWFTTDTSGSRSGNDNEDVWETVTTTLTFNSGDDLFANAASRFAGVTIGDIAAFDLNTMVIRAV